MENNKSDGERMNLNLLLMIAVLGNFLKVYKITFLKER